MRTGTSSDGGLPRAIKIVAILIMSLAAIVIAAVTLFLAALGEPWPLSLRQGPDTRYSKQAYERQFGGPVPAAITDLYAREEWGFGGDSIYSISFTFREDRIVDAIIHQLELIRVPEGERTSLRVLSGPRWWPTKERLLKIPEAYQRGGVDYLWVDRAEGRAYFQRANL